MRVVLPLLICLGIASHVYTQTNLVENGSFEQMTYCPSNFNQQQLRTVEKWNQASEGTPDYFNQCSEKVGVPKNVFGEEPAQDGIAYMGFASFSPGKRNYREYIQTRLTRPLKRGELVCVEFYVSAADFSKYVIDGIGACLTEKKISHTRNDVIDASLALSNPRLNMLDETHGWMLLSDIYEAAGGEEYITIGNFKPDGELKVLKRTREMGATEVSQGAYLYVDNVVVRPIVNREQCHCSVPELAAAVHDPPLELDEVEQLKLDAVLFDFDQDLLTDTAKIQLNEIYRIMLGNKSVVMEISGHTDIIGSDDYNVQLSKKRAERVISYLEGKGISGSRLQVKFFGKSQPVAPNDTDEGRAQNRRVEFRVVQKRFELVH
ncbi:MAG: OmpA family protein [Flavobacteriales bacterium]|nr:OmpA family protein [Flavobacteriales bacterium]